ncbi:MAG: pseudouridine synthase [Wolbachia sp.]
MIYDYEDIIVLNKQSGLTVHQGARANNDTLLNPVIAHFGKIPYINARPGIVHRLDKDTSVLMVIAKMKKTIVLSELLSNHKIKR